GRSEGGHVYKLNKAPRHWPTRRSYCPFRPTTHSLQHFQNIVSIRQAAKCTVKVTDGSCCTSMVVFGNKRFGAFRSDKQQTTKVDLLASPPFVAATSSPVVYNFAAPEQVVALETKPVDSSIHLVDPFVVVPMNNFDNSDFFF
ncbi:hypothetical protein Tco_1073792, partial [Tanacetum coccineum]